jgi:hypothetical protein
VAVFSLGVAYSHANTTSCQFSIPSQVASVETRFEQGLAGYWERSRVLGEEQGVGRGAGCWERSRVHIYRFY